MRSNPIIIVLAVVATRLAGCSGTIGDSANEPAPGPATSGSSGTGSSATGAGSTTTGAGTGGPGTGGMPPSGPFRLLAPMSTSTVTTKHPTLHWAPGEFTGATVEICADRACSSIVETADVGGFSFTPRALQPGTYFWHAYPTNGSLKKPTPSPTWQFTVGVRSAPIDASWGSTLDLNGDGYADVMIGAAYSETGRVHWYPGGPSGLPTTPVSSLTNPQGVPSAFGISVASAGDVNGDGYGDVVVGAPAADDDAGRAYVYFGGPSGPPSDPSIVLNRPPAETNQFGGCVSSAGDVNGDGYADVLIGAASTVGSSAISGAVYVFFGGPSGLASSPDGTLSSPDGPGTYFGSSVASAGDFNGDGYADVIIGAYGAKELAGRAYVYFGDASGLNGPIPLVDVGRVGAAFGVSVASAGDVNGDGLADIVVGAAALSTGKDGSELQGVAYIYKGSNSFWSRAPDATLTGRVSERFGISVASAGDVNRDGFSDVVIGASGGGKAYLYLGVEAGFPATEAVTFSGSTGVGGGFGISVAGAGDTDGDGSSDIVVGAYRFSNSTGRAFVFLGKTSGPSSTPHLEIASPGGELGAFGISVASVPSKFRFQ